MAFEPSNPFRHPFNGIYKDLKTRLIPYYKSDLIDSITYRIIPSTIYIFLINLLPAISFSQDLFNKTDNLYGINEILLSSSIGGIVFGLFSGQPLVIVGVTGPISIFNYTIYEILKKRKHHNNGDDNDRDGLKYFEFICWVYLWSMIFHFIIAIFNWVNLMRFITRFSCDIFGFFINIVYIQKGIEIITKQFTSNSKNEEELSMNNLIFLQNQTRGYLSLTISLLFLIFGICFYLIGNKSKLFNLKIRKFFDDYGTPICVLFFTGFIHFNKSISTINLSKLSITKSFIPTISSYSDPIDYLNIRPHGWFIHFWKINVGDIFLAIPFALLLTFLFYFDHNVSSLMCQDSKYPLKKPSSFHWDFLLLGLTTGISGILGIPAPNGLIPQAPLHTESLSVYKHEKGNEYIIDHVVEQRATNTIQGLLTLGTMTGPLLKVLGLIPQAILTGLFWVMGISGLINNGITNKLIFIFTSSLNNKNDVLMKCNFKSLILFVVIELIIFGLEFGITCTKGAVGFPGVLLLSSVIIFVFPFIFKDEDLEILDQPTAPQFIMESLMPKDDVIIDYIVDEERK